MTIYVGIGGWTFEHWRGVFYPEGLPQRSELHFASRHLTSIEINGTFYRTPSAANFRHWAAETPDGFTFSVKGPRSVTHRKALAEAGPSIGRFFASGVTELGLKLGPVLWQLPPTKRFAPDDIAAFLALLPREREGRPIRHALEVRHDSFRDPAFVALMRGANVPIVHADTDNYPSIAEMTGDFVYARLMRSAEEEPEGYAPAALRAWAERIRSWAEGGARDCFIYVISGAKVRAPAAAMALIESIRTA